MATTAAAIAAATGAVAYLNGKYHLGQDIKMLKFRRDAAKHYEDLGMFPLRFRQPLFTSRHVNCDITRSFALIHNSTKKTPISLVLFRATSRKISR